MKDDSPGRRAAAYWFADGLPDIVFGLTLVVFAAAGILWRVYAPHAPLYDLWLMAGGFLLFYWKEREVLDILKSRLTYPRTGYVQPPDEPSPSSGLTALSLEPSPPADENVTYFIKRTVMVVFFLLYCSFNRPVARWFAPLVILLLAAMLYVGNRKSEHPYRWWWALILALSGLVFLLVDVPPALRPLLSYLLVGGWLVTQGLFTLVQYLRANPSQPAPEGVRA